MRTVAAILAAGRGERFGGDKASRLLGSKPVWRWSYDVFAAHLSVETVFLVTAPERVDHMLANLPAGCVVAGGTTRQESSEAALARAEALGADVLLLHDAARPFISTALITAVIQGVEAVGAAAPGVPVTDTVKRVAGGTVETVPRDNLVAMQTPQGAKVDLLRRAHAASTNAVTDDMALIEAVGVHPAIVPGEPSNFKITLPEDFARAEAMIGTESRTGIGYDIHPFSDNPERALYLGGVLFPGHAGLVGHSDADVLLHAVTDALLGAAGLGDIGAHFPPSDSRWKDEPSLTFLRHAIALLAGAGWQVLNIDATCIAEGPRIMPRAEAMRAAIAEAAGISPGRVSVKATTNERLGSIGRGEGIAAIAVATIRGTGPRS